MTKEQLIAKYKEADMQGKRLLGEVNNKDYQVSALATIQLNACTNTKNYCLLELGKLEVKDA